MARKTAKKKNIITLKGKSNLFKSVFKLIAKAYTEEVCKAEGNNKISFYDVAFVYYKTCDMVYGIVERYMNEIEYSGKDTPYELWLDLEKREIGFKVLNSKNKVNIEDTFEYTFMYFPEDDELISMINSKLDDEMDDVEYWLEDCTNFAVQSDWKPCKSLLDSIDKFRACLKETLKNTLKGE